MEVKVTDNNAIAEPKEVGMVIINHSRDGAEKLVRYRESDNAPWIGENLLTYNWADLTNPTLPQSEIEAKSEETSLYELVERLDRFNIEDRSGIFGTHFTMGKTIDGEYLSRPDVLSILKISNVDGK